MMRLIHIVMMAGLLASAPTPFYCNLKALTPAEREEHQQLAVRLAESVVRIEEIPDGYLFEIDRARVSIKELGAWTAFEQRCCPFFDFLLKWSRENGPLTLRLTGREGVKPFIRSEFSKIFR
jgi:hypothetical protein